MSGEFDLLVSVLVPWLVVDIVMYRHRRWPTCFSHVLLVLAEDLLHHRVGLFSCDSLQFFIVTSCVWIHKMAWEVVVSSSAISFLRSFLL